MDRRGSGSVPKAVCNYRKRAPASIVNHLAGDEGHFVAHDYARDVVKAYFDSVTSSVDEQWKLYEKICCGHMSMSGMLNKTYRP